MSFKQMVFEMTVEGVTNHLQRDPFIETGFSFILKLVSVSLHK